MKANRWLTCFLLLAVLLFLCAGALVAYVDPFFHYHAPHTECFFYTIDSERNQNNGIVRHFDYDAIITGSSMTANFRTSELDALFGTHSVKLPAAGATLYEINNLICTALENNSELHYVFRSVDRNLLIYGADVMRNDLGEYPSYLYDQNLLNDYRYLLNADVLFGRTIPMLIQARQPDFAPGYTSFDEYSSTVSQYTGSFGLHTLAGLFQYELGTVGEPVHLTEKLRETVGQNISQNVVAVAQEHPDVIFYCFLPPYSLAYWHDKVASGDIYAQFEAEQIAIELMLQCDNIRLFDFSCRRDIISDVNNYRDLLHYGEWVNSLILKWMHDDQYRLTKENYKAHLDEQLVYYLTYDYSALVRQERYNCDYYAAALLNRELTGVVPHKLTEEELRGGMLKNAVLELEPDTGALMLCCTGTLACSEDQDLVTYLRDMDYIGMKLVLPDAGGYSYLCFKGQNTCLNGQPTVIAYDKDGMPVSIMMTKYFDLKGGWQLFSVDLRAAKGTTSIIFNGGYTDGTGHPASSFVFKDFVLY